MFMLLSVIGLEFLYRQPIRRSRFFLWRSRGDYVVDRGIKKGFLSRAVVKCTSINNSLLYRDLEQATLVRGK